MANTILAQQLDNIGEAKADRASITIEGEPPIDLVREHLGSLYAFEISALPDPRAIENLKFSEALPRALAEHIYLARFHDVEAIH